VTPTIAEEMNLSSDQEGVLVQDVQQGSAADQAGLRAGDQPLTLNGQEILVGATSSLPWTASRSAVSRI